MNCACCFLQACRSRDFAWGNGSLAAVLVLPDLANLLVRMLLLNLLERCFGRKGSGVYTAVCVYLQIGFERDSATFICHRPSP